MIKVEQPSMEKLLVASLTKPHFLGGLVNEFLHIIVVFAFTEGPIPFIIYYLFVASVVDYTLLQIQSAVQWRAGFIANELKLNNKGDDLFNVLIDNSPTLVPAKRIVPGDVVLLDPTNDAGRELPCDALLLNGSVWTSEAVLTGEDKEIHKRGIKGEATERLNLNRDSVHSAIHLLRGGCRMMRIEPAGMSIEQLYTPFESIVYMTTLRIGEDSVCRLYVLKTGYGTVKGGIYAGATGSGGLRTGVLRDYLYMFALFGFLCIVSLVLDVLNYSTGEYDVPPWAVGALMLWRLFQAVPWIIPVIYSQQLGFVSIALRRQQIVCIDRERLVPAGCLQVCCFDKTGTLTESEMDVKKVVEISRGEGKNKSYAKASARTKLVLRLCHSLAAETEGDKLELAMFAFATDSKIMGPDRVDVKGKDSYEKIKVFPFDADLKYMSVVAVPDDERSKGWLLAKGDPAQIATKLQSVPRRFHEIANELASKGYRVLALASRQLDLATEDVDNLSREDMESGLTFCAFLCFHNALKRCTQSVLEDLQRSRHRLKMITGDHVLTALFVAESLKFFPPGKVKIMMCESKEKGISLVDPSDYVAEDSTEEERGGEDSLLFGSKPKWLPWSREPVTIDLKPLLKGCNVAITGKALAYLVEHYPREAVILACERAVVFARVKPSQKETIIRAIKESKDKPNCLMCGDGLNDIRALSASSVGVALSPALSLSDATEEDGKADVQRNPVQIEQAMPRAQEPVVQALSVRQQLNDAISSVIASLRSLGRAETWRSLLDLDLTTVLEAVLRRIRRVVSVFTQDIPASWELVVEGLENLSLELAEQQAKKETAPATVLSTGHFRCVGDSVEGVSTIVRNGRALMATLVYRFNLIFVRQVVGRASFFMFTRDHMQLSMFTAYSQTLLSRLLDILSVLQMFKPAKRLKGKAPVAFASKRNLDYLSAQATVQVFSLYLLKVLVDWIPEEDAPEIPQGRFEYVEPSMTNTIHYIATLAFYINITFSLVPVANLDAKYMYSVLALTVGTALAAGASGMLQLYDLPGTYKAALVSLIGFNTVASWGLQH